jgi:Nup133 N terminal like
VVGGPPLRAAVCVWPPQVCHTRGLAQFLPSFLHRTAFLGLFQLPAAIVEVVIDEDRGVLYTRTQSSGIQLYDLGPGGDGAPRHVAEVTDIIRDAARAQGGAARGVRWWFPAARGCMGCHKPCFAMLATMKNPIFLDIIECLGRHAAPVLPVTVCYVGMPHLQTLNPETLNTHPKKNHSHSALKP